MIISQKPTKKNKRARYALLIEDNANHAELITEILDQYFSPIVIHTVDNIDYGLEFTEQTSYDIVLTDAVIQDEPITMHIASLRKNVNHIPIIVISGHGDETLASELVKNGATGYITKTQDNLAKLPALIEHYMNQSPKMRRRKVSTQTCSAAPTAQQLIKKIDDLIQNTLSLSQPQRNKRPRIADYQDNLKSICRQMKKLRRLAVEVTEQK